MLLCLVRSFLLIRVVRRNRGLCDAQQLRGIVSNFRLLCVVCERESGWVRDWVGREFRSCLSGNFEVCVCVCVCVCTCACVRVCGWVGVCLWFCFHLC